MRAVPRTLQGRLTVLVTVVVAVAFALTGAVILQATGRAQARALEEDLSERLTILQRGIGPPRPDGQGGPGRGRPPSLAGVRSAAERSLGPGFFVVISSAEGEVLTTLGDAPEVLPTPPARSGPDAASLQQVLGADGGTYLLRDAGRDADGLALRIGVDVDRVIGGTQRALRDRFLLLGAAATALTALVTSFAVGVATRPLRALRAATDRVADTQDLTTRVAVKGGPGEIEAVALGLNTMLERLEATTTAREASLGAARRFAADAGHELRTPLTSIQATLDALARNPDLPDATREEAVGEVRAEARRLAALLESLQALARADAGFAGDAEVVDLDDVVDAAAAAVGSQHPELVVEVAGEGPHAVVGSTPWVRSILDNLLVNAAVHARHPGGPAPTVRIGVQSEGRWLVVRVDDDGPGIPADQHERVLERFTRGVDAARRPGSGLGLSLVAQLVALHGGTLDLGTAPSGGLRVEVRLPSAAA